MNLSSITGTLFEDEMIPFSGGGKGNEQRATNNGLSGMVTGLDELHEQLGKYLGRKEIREQVHEVI
jgi:hypothetical protein